jgi:hypothetical protein
MSKALALLAFAFGFALSATTFHHRERVESSACAFGAL